MSVMLINQLDSAVEVTSSSGQLRHNFTGVSCLELMLKLFYIYFSTYWIIKIFIFIHNMASTKDVIIKPGEHTQHGVDPVYRYYTGVAGLGWSMDTDITYCLLHDVVVVLVTGRYGDVVKRITLCTILNTILNEWLEAYRVINRIATSTLYGPE
jgi:hypothetical protein